MASSIPSLTDLKAQVGAFLSSGKLGSVGAGAKAAEAASKIQTDVLAAMNKAGAWLGPILGTSGVNAFASGAGGAAGPSQSSVYKGIIDEYAAKITPAVLGGIAALGLFVGWLIFRKRR